MLITPADKRTHLLLIPLLDPIGRITLSEPPNHQQCFLFVFGFCETMLKDQHFTFSIILGEVTSVCLSREKWTDNNNHY